MRQSLPRLFPAALAAVLLAATALGCGDDSAAPPDGGGGSGGSGGTAGTGGAGGQTPDGGVDAFIRPDGGYPGNIGIPCDFSRNGSDCGSTTDYICLPPDFFGCTPGFCSKQCSDANPCPDGTVCDTLPILDRATGLPTALRHCFLPCTTQNDCGDPGRLYCDVQRHICSVGQYLENVGSLGAHQPSGAACQAPAPAPTPTLFGANVSASDPALSGPSEPFLAVDPADPNLIYVTYNGFPGGSHVSVTTNGGATWTHHSIGQLLADDDGGDPVVAVDPTTREVWHSYLTGGSGQCGPMGQYPGNNAIHLAHAPMGGASWTGPIRVNDPQYSADRYFLDKPWMTIAPNGTIYVSFTVFPTALDVVTTDIVLASSSDHGATWRNIVVNDATPDRAHGRQLSGLVTDQSNRLYLVWTEDTGNPDDLGGYTWFATSSDGGATVTHPNVRIHDTPNALFDDPQLAVSADGSKLYVVYGTVVPGGQPDEEDLAATFSSDGGQSWQTPIAVNDDPSCATHWHPAAVADQAGRLWVVWYDERYGDGRVRWARGEASGGALSIVDRGWVTDAAPAFTTSRVRFFMGDYIGLATAGGRLYAAWGDLREIESAGAVRMFVASGALPTALAPLGEGDPIASGGVLGRLGLATELPAAAAGQGFRIRPSSALARWREQGR